MSKIFLQIGLYEGSDFIVSGYFDNKWHPLRNFGEHMESGRIFKERLYNSKDENLVRKFAKQYDPDKIFCWRKNAKAFVSKRRISKLQTFI